MVAEYEKNAGDQIFTVKGCVHHPGAFRLKHGQGMKLSEALRLAGGTINGNYFAGERAAYLIKIHVLRLEGGTVIAFELDVRPGHSDGDFEIKPGDSIFVPELV